MSQPRFPNEWRTLYAAAMLESDSERLCERIEKAHAAMDARLQELVASTSMRSEQEELHSALKYLGTLKATLQRA